MRRQFWRQSVLCACLLAGFLFAGSSPSKADTPLGAGLNGQVDYTGDFAFVDTLATAGAFHAINNGSLDLSNLAPTNAHGYPTTDFGFYVNEIAPLTGTYKLVLVANTQPNVYLQNTPGSVTNVVWNSATHTLTADVNVGAGASVFVLDVTNTNGGVSQIHLYRPGYAQNNAPSNLYTTYYQNLISVNNPNLLRFMDYHATNGNIETDWADRSLPTDATQELSTTKVNLPSDGNYPNAGTYPYNGGVLTSGKGICWEFIIALANQQNKDAWINIPITATPDYVLKLAQLVKFGSDGLNPYTSAQANPKWAPLKSNLHVWIEYSNEVWNDQFVQTHINRGLGLTEVANGTAWGGGPCNLNYDGVNDVNYIGDRRVADHLKQMSEIFGAVFGPGSINTTVRPVLAYQVSNLSRFSNQLAYMEAVYGLGAPKKYFYGLAGAPYFGTQDTGATYTKQDILDQFNASVAGYQNGPDLTRFAAIATYYGLKMCAYEGGPDTFGPFNIQSKKDATLDPQMQGIVVNYLNAWFSHGGDQFNWFVIGAGNFDNQYGTYSITDDVFNLNEPKELGFQQVRAETLPAVTIGAAVPGEVDARFTQGVANTFSGSYDVRFIAAGSTFDYLFNAPTAGTYKIVVNAGNVNAGPLPVQILLNDQAVGTDTLPASTDGVYHDTPGLTATFQKGLNVVRVLVPQGRPAADTYTLNSVKVENANGSGITNTLPYAADFFVFYPSIYANQSYTNLFTVGDNETPASAITVTASSDNPALIPNANISIAAGAFTGPYGDKHNRNLVIKPAADQTGSANITLTLTDGGGLSRSLVFRLTVQGAFTSTPTNLTATAGSNSVVLNWKQGTDGAGATSFTVLRSLTSGGPYDTLATGVTGLTYTDATAVNGTTYYYVVMGTSGIGGDSGLSNEASAKPFTPPAAPVLTAVGGYSYITLSWNPIAGAISYNVKRSATQGGPYTTIGTTTATTYTDLYLGQGTKFFYVVSAVTASGEGPNSNEASAVTGAAVPGEIEARIINAPGYGYGASPYVKFIGAGSTFTYNVNAASAGSYDITVSAGDGNSTAYPLQIAVNGGANQTVTVQPTQENFFLDTAPITANLTAGANTITLTVPDNRPYDLNTLKITPHGQVITNTLPFTSFYAFYPEIAANTAYTNLFEVHDNITPSDQIVVTASSDNQTLFPNANVQVQKGDFVIYGFHFPRQLVATPAPNQSGSATITVVVTNGTGLSRTMFFKLTVDAPVIPPAPTNLSASLDNAKTTLTWTVSVGAATYNVYRSLVSGGPYTQIASGLAATTYTNTGLTNGTTYYYVVTAASSAGESGYSNQASVTPQVVAIGNGDGLYGQYYTGDDPTFTFTGKTPILQIVDPTINFQYQTGGLQFAPRSFDAGLPNSNYTARWTGKVLAPVTGNYVFTTITDDGSVLYVNGAKVVDNNHYQAATAVSSSPVALVGGQQYTIEMDYYQGGGGASAQLTWQYPGQAQQIIPQTQLFSGQVTGATVSGNIALEGVANLAVTSAAAPLGVFDIQLRNPNTHAVVYENKNVALTKTAGSPNGKYTLTGITAGTYDVWIKGGKNLAVLIPGVVVSASGGTVPDAFLPGGDSDNSNTVDATDFSTFVGAYNSDSSIPGSGYDPTADYNFDGAVDATDFGIFVGNYNTVGAP